MKKHLIIITVLAVFSFAEASNNPKPTIDELKNEIYGLTQKIKMYKTELKKKDETIKQLKSTIVKLATRTTQPGNSSIKSNNSIRSNSSYAQQLAQQRDYQKKQQKESYKRLVSGNTASLKLYYKKKADLQKKYNYAIKQYNNAGQLIGKSRRKDELRKWSREVSSLKYKIEKLDKNINSLEQSNARYTAYTN